MPPKLITKKQLEWLALAAGYDNYLDYAQDKELERCDTCEKWGLHGEEIYSRNGRDWYCDKHRPEETKDENL